ncbi:MAG: substrate-binding domain-containing protein [Deltaproteobacteria bacterium]|nr:substrate-binding domain-containing protein [Deltaproteobacteria bacterium]
MKRKLLFIGTVMSAMLLLIVVASIPQVIAKDVLKYSSSAQIREVFQEEKLEEFTKQTGIDIDLFVGSSDAAVKRLMNGLSDIASTVTQLGPRHKIYGYEQIPLCEAPLVVITNAKTPVRNITKEQLRDVFRGEITNWKDLGGPNEPIAVVIPGKNTGAYQNFKQLALKRFDIKYDYMAYRSTMVIKVVHRIPWSISFISQSSTVKETAVKILKIDGLRPDDKGYPYYQTLSFVTKGKPSGAAKKLVDFAFSEKGKEIIKKNGLKPLSR